MNRPLLRAVGALFTVALLLCAIGAASAQANWRVGGKTFAELGIEKETFASEGTFKLEIPGLSTTVNCNETGTGTLNADGVSSQNVTLSGCVMVGQEKNCKISFYALNLVPDSYGRLNGAEGVLTRMIAEGTPSCPWIGGKESTFTNPQESITDKYGSEAVNLPVTRSATTLFGLNPTYISGSSTWRLTGANKGANLAQVLPKYSFSASYGSKGTGDGQFSGEGSNIIGGIDFDAAGDFWVADWQNSRLQKFNTSGTYLSQFGSLGEGNGQFVAPADVAIDSSGNIWVIDRFGRRVQEFTPSGTYIRQFGSKGTGNGQFENPTGIDVDPSGNVWVTDVANNRVQEFSSSGTYIRQFGSKGTGNGQFESPRGIAVDIYGNVWVGDAGNCRVQKFSSTGSYLAQFGSCGVVTPKIGSPSGLTFDAEGHIWLGDSGNERVMEFTRDGEYITKYGTAGSGKGQFGGGLQGIGFDQQNNLWVTDSGNVRLQKWVH